MLHSVVHSAGAAPPPRLTRPRRPPPAPCSFLLQLALLDLECSTYAPSLVAAAALSLSLATFGKPGWPLALQQFGSYREADLEPARARLLELQATQVRRRRWHAAAAGSAARRSLASRRWRMSACALR